MHRPCGQPMLPLLVCRACREPIDIGNIRVEIVAEPDERQVSLPKHCLHTGANSWREVEDRDRARRSTSSAIAGRRWCRRPRITACTGSQTSRRRCAVPTNTLADRLRLLVQAGVFSRTPYQDNPPRYAYRLTEKGRALYLPAFTLHQWADRWLLRGRVAPIQLRAPALRQARRRARSSATTATTNCVPSDVEPQRPAATARRGVAAATFRLTGDERERMAESTARIRAGSIRRCRVASIACCPRLLASARRATPDARLPAVRGRQALDLRRDARARATCRERVCAASAYGPATMCSCGCRTAATPCARGSAAISRGVFCAAQHRLSRPAARARDRAVRREAS